MKKLLLSIMFSIFLLGFASASISTTYLNGTSVTSSQFCIGSSCITNFAGNDPNFNQTWVNQNFINISNITINNGIKFFYNQTEGTFSYINSNFSAGQVYSDTNLQGNLSANNSKWSSTFNATYDNFWLSNTTIWNAINSASGGNESWNQSFAETLFYPLVSNPAGYITNLVSDLVNYFTKTEVNEMISQNLSVSKTYTNDVLQGNLSANITNVYSNINISGTILYNNITSTITGQSNYTNGTGINLTNGNFSIRLDYLDGIYARIVNFFSKQDIVDMISQNRTAVLNDANVYTNNQIIGNFTANLTAINSNLTNSFVPYLGANKNTNLGAFNLTTSASVNTGNLTLTNGVNTATLSINGSNHICLGC